MIKISPFVKTIPLAIALVEVGLLGFVHFCDFLQ